MKIKEWYKQVEIRIIIQSNIKIFTDDKVKLRKGTFLALIVIGKAKNVVGL